MGAEQVDGAGSGRGAIRARRRRRALIALMIVLTFVAAMSAAVAIWWFHFRPQPPKVRGAIDPSILSEPTALCVADLERPCRTAETVEAFLEEPGLIVRAGESTSGGMQGAIALVLEGASGEVLKAKFRPQSSASIVNEPAKELAAYELQMLLLEPDDYVIPPVRAHCFDGDQYDEALGIEGERVPGTDCVFGYLAYWLGDVKSVLDVRQEGLLPMPPDGLYDRDPHLFHPERFERGGGYRRNTAILNLITHLVNNGDAHAGQFVLYTEPWHAFVVDSSIAFQSLQNPTVALVQDLAEIQVPGIPEDVAGRLRRLSRSDLDRLARLSEHELTAPYRPVSPGAVVDADERVRRTSTRLQVGLTESDLDDLWDRVRGVQSALGSGRLGTF